MICIGILSERKKKTGIVKKLFKPVELCGVFEDSIRLAAAEFVYTAEEISKLPRFYYRFLCEIGMRKLKKAGAEKVFLTKGCEADYNCCDFEDSGIPTERFGDAVCFAADYIGSEALKGTACIKDRELSLTDYHTLSAICRKVRYIKILTDNIATAEKTAEKLYDEYGVFPEILEYSEKVPNDALLTADADNRTIRLGRGITIDGAEAELDLHGYDADKQKILAYIKEKGVKLKYKSWLAGKNRLTR